MNAPYSQEALDAVAAELARQDDRSPGLMDIKAASEILAAAVTAERKAYPMRKMPMSGLPIEPVGITDEEWARRHLEHNLKSAARGDPEDWHRSDMLPDPEPSKTAREERESENMAAPMPPEYEAAHAFMSSLFGPDSYTPDSIGQLVEVFIPCLRIMVTRGYDPSGGLWRRAGILGIIWDVRKKFERLWYRTWTLGKRHDDSGFDLINFTGMLLRAEPDSRFGDAGEPAEPRTF